MKTHKHTRINYNFGKLCRSLRRQDSLETIAKLKKTCLDSIQDQSQIDSIKIMQSVDIKSTINATHKTSDWWLYADSWRIITTFNSQTMKIENQSITGQMGDRCLTTEIVKNILLAIKSGLTLETVCDNSYISRSDLRKFINENSWAQTMHEDACRARKYAGSVERRLDVVRRIIPRIESGLTLKQASAETGLPHNFVLKTFRRDEHKQQYLKAMIKSGRPPVSHMVGTIKQHKTEIIQAIRAGQSLKDLRKKYCFTQYAWEEFMSKYPTNLAKYKDAIVDKKQATMKRLRVDVPKTDYKLPVNCTFFSLNTKRAYMKAWNCFMEFCQMKNISCFPATQTTVCRYMRWRAQTVSVKAITMLELSGILATHKLNNKTLKRNKIDECIKELKIKYGFKSRQVKPLLASDLARILSLPDNDSSIKIRDNCLLAVGFAGALRRSELTALKVKDVELINNNKAYIHIRKSKTDQAGVGYKIPIINGKKVQPITVLKRYLDVFDLSDSKDEFLIKPLTKAGTTIPGQIHDSDISRIIKFYVEKINKDPKQYSGHSLRAGFITSAAMVEARIDKIMDVSRHKSADMVLKYIRDTNKFKQHAAAKFM